jgi:hypothetical protein
MQTSFSALQFAQADKARELAAMRASEEEALAATLAQQAHERDRAEREVQHLRLQSEELRA